MLDLDSQDGERVLGELELENGELPETVRALTRNGRHFYFRLPAGTDVRNSASKIAPGIDVRGTGGYVVAPPSPHPDGGSYQWDETAGPDDVAVAEAPHWLLELVKVSPNGDRPAPAAPVGDVIPSGVRNATLTSLAGTMRWRGMSEDAIVAALLEENARCEPPLSDSEVRTVAASVARYQPHERDGMVQVVTEGTRPGRSYGELIDAAEVLSPGFNLDELEKIVAETIHLEPVRRSRIYRALKKSTGLALGTIRQQAAAALKTDTGDEPDHLDLARRVVTEVGAENIIGTEGAVVWQWEERGVWRPMEPRALKHLVQESLAGDQSLEITRPLIDSVTDVFVTHLYRPGRRLDVGDSDVVNVLNGELHTLPDGRWELRPHDRESYRTTQLPVAWSPEADAPRFTRFLEEVFKGDPDTPEKIRVVLEMIGYTLMAHTRYEWFIILVGGGSNGKSVLLFVLEALLGRENVAAVQPSSFGRSFQRAELHCKLANIISELHEGEGSCPNRS